MGSFYQFTSRVERTKGLEDKTEFWDRLVVMIMMTIFNSLVSLLCRPTRTLERSKTRKPLKEEDCLADLSGHDLII